MDDTSIGAGNGQFPLTRRSAIDAVRGEDEATRRAALEDLIAAYWKPCYKYIRLKWRQSNEEAKDLTQAFFTRALEKGFLEDFDPQRARFRTYLRLCLDGFVSNERKAAGRQKRGGDQVMLPLDFETAEGELRQMEIPDGASLDDYFHREWVRNLFSLAVDELRRQCEFRGRQAQFRLFERYDLEDREASLTYQHLAAEFGLPVTTVTNHLAAMRREFRAILLARLRQITSGEREFQEEARFLLGR